MHSSAYDAIVFDFFGVICSEIAPFWLPRHFSIERSVEIKQSIVAAADVGEISAESMFDQIGALAGLPSSQVEQEWLALAHIDLGLVAQIKRLRTRTTVALLTNAPSRLFRTIERQNDLSGLFDETVVSSEVGYAKPQREIYTIMLERLGITADRALFIDDNPVNVEGARNTGMQAILFESAEATRPLIDQL